MKINKGRQSGISGLFQARANPWAPKYEQHLWNDVSQTAYDLTFKRYEPVLQAAAKAVGFKIDRSSAVARLLHNFSDDNLRLVTDRPEHEISIMRGKFMHFLNTTCMSTNCYAYGLDIRHGFKPGDLLTPGYLKEIGGACNQPLIGKSVTALFDGLAKDGFAFFNGHPNRDRPPAGFYLTALLVHHDKSHHDKIRDFHFVRYDRDGGCSHKPGHGYVSRSNRGKDIIDPTGPGAFDDYKYEGCILVPAVLPQHQLS